jgi:hypothetical protein
MENLIEENELREGRRIGFRGRDVKKKGFQV